MQKIQLTDMVEVALLDRDGQAITLDVALYQYEETVAVFLSETDEHPGIIARSSATLIEQLKVQFDLDVMSTTFLRHIAVASVGSLFGRFKLTWRGGEVVSYTFSMLNGIGEEREVRHIIAEGVRLTVIETA